MTRSEALRLAIRAISEGSSALIHAQAMAPNEARLVELEHRADAITALRGLLVEAES